jgi:hypothetical protein
MNNPSENFLMIAKTAFLENKEPQVSIKKPSMQNLLQNIRAGVCKCFAFESIFAANGNRQKQTFE